ncbi:putative metalloprotease CJM1_0395 family protein [Pseudoalteromonas xiamenensis]|uniref:Catalase n=1 Tax=Pseudoalteromonas xiamenensis TaxID=882626 RepID=A0A975DG48_9GAMM|nr:putative metalloprotease CJM1_0395 family protein [Pseudoalteromonas xiamenensis]QTH70492.1 catalase [Pseudoalteromonas xiamenensis]
MNIVTPQPALNFHTGNVYTETARRDNQLREVIPQPAQAAASFTENKAYQDTDKAKQAPSDEKGLYDKKGQLEDKQAVQGRDAKDEHGHEEGEHSNSREEQKAEAELKQIEELKDRDTEVRLHEEAHARVGGQHAGSPSYEFQKGPDGTNYAVGGEVMIDVAEVPGDPQGTIDKMQTVRAAALAPAEPSGADRAIAADASRKIAAAQAELSKQALNGDEEDDKTRVNSFERRRLAGEDEDASLNTAQSDVLEAKENPVPSYENRSLKKDRNPDVESRAMRIADFYQHVHEPKSASGFNAYI